ncbi:nucleoside hydrolase [Weissella paramesenteroides]|uniref:nucleoside hydrolase n=1 Tax=Weissella paramesenteroides TaxID=1249 RepID=UPI002073FC2E|nr:nucleoside hydrolase [Weissella paramesenteroides]MCM6764681.1 nucleoside hydrolase [Weissella paramesenteroides]MCM6768209.1 nucleoside hydrolase [Weissella paramesenteroides]MCM6768541.1 nucleoside hydrolase [Weissella paramesenteroides]MCM6770618.1 nucleoside hydrolase [Weissella paramesenteroides]MCM6780541.1 nucleoside hydrolase [Weissella paramesenteroides]
MKNVYFNHDGNVDDLVSLLLLLQMPDVNLLGVGVTDADGYVDPSVSASRKIVDLFGHEGRQPKDIAKSNSRAVHQFPKEWRLSSFSFDDFPILNEHGEPKTPVAEKPGHLDMIDKIKSSDDKVTVVMTGPLSDLARALEVDPSITENIESVHWMGGALNSKGNVAEPGADDTMEWNAYWDAEAVKKVWDSDLKIVMVGLDSTDQVPLTSGLRMRWATQRQHPALDLIGQGYSLVHSFEANSIYYLWDVLTTLASRYPELVESVQVKTDVITTGASEGRTYQTDDGREVTFVTSVDAEAFYDKIDELAKLGDKK